MANLAPTRREMLGAISIIPVAAASSDGVRPPVEKWESALTVYRASLRELMAHCRIEPPVRAFGYVEWQHQNGELALKHHNDLVALLATPSPNMAALHAKIEVYERHYEVDAPLADLLADAISMARVVM